MKVDILNVTPVMADEWLAKNNSNRKINKKQLDMIVRSIHAGKWRLTHQGIAFYEDGQLADGQHRLQAIKDTGVSLEMPIFRGIERDVDTILAIDCGKGRSVVDSASISGLSIKDKDVSLVKGLRFGYDSGAFPKLTHSESCDLCTEYFDEINICNELFKKHKPFISIVPVKVGIVKAVRSGVSMGVARSFVDAMVTGEYDKPIFANAIKIRNKLIEKNYNGGSDRLLAFNMAYNTLIKTNKNQIVKSIRSK